VSDLSESSADLPDLTVEFVERFNEQLQIIDQSSRAAENAEMEALKSQLEQALEDLATTEQSCQDCDAQLQNYAEQVAEQTQTIEQLKTDGAGLDSADDEDFDFKSVQDATEIDNLRKENLELRGKAQALANRVDALTVDNKETWKANESFSKSLKKKTRQLEKLQAKLEKQAPQAISHTSQTNGLGELGSIEGTRDELLARIRDELDQISRLDRLFQQYGLDLAKVPPERLGELAAVFAYEHEIKKLKHAHVIRTRHR
jgi:chromosome segregation ATPase